MPPKSCFVCNQSLCWMKRLAKHFLPSRENPARGVISWRMLPGFPALSGCGGAAGTGVPSTLCSPPPALASLQFFHPHCGRPRVWKGNSHCRSVWDPERDCDAVSSEGINLRAFLPDVSNLSLVECQSNGKRQ